MSLVSTLAKVALGVAVAKGMGHVLQQAGTTTARTTTTRTGTSGGSLEDILGGMLGGGQPMGRRTDGLGGMLEGLSRASRPARGGAVSPATQSAAPTGGGLDDILGGLAGRSGGGGLGDLIGAIAGAAASGRGGSFGDILNQAIRTQAEPETRPNADQEYAAGLMLKAMIQAAMSDGRLDETEKTRILDRLGDVSKAERDFVNAQLRKPADPDGLAREVPKGLEPQVYAMAVMGIDLDSKAEAQFLHRFAQALAIDPRTVNHIHEELGAPALYG